MNPTVGLGSKAMIGGAIGAWAAFLTAAIDAGSSWYTDPSVVALLVTAVLAVVALFTGRSYQAGKITAAGDAAVRAYDDAPEPAPIAATDVSATPRRVAGR